MRFATFHYSLLQGQQALLDKSKEPFSIRAKKFFPVEKAEWVLENWSPKLCHENDGLIFNPAEEPYEAGQSSELLKWKPHTLNSVDFVLNIRTVRQEGCIPESVGALMVGGFDRPFAQIKVTKELKSLDKKVVECTWDAKNKQWKFLRVREDKSFPNGYKTAMSVCKSIQQPVTKKWLLEVIEKHRYHSVRHRDPNAPSTSHAAV
ncbi:mRNA-capping enzyme-like [Pocillopora verrucosa]|uniref:mRNA-capping enzyme-like n=1 Tax=Pocillopora verrucosa TaxID=203993 RepID=UPI0033417241